MSLSVSRFYYSSDASYLKRLILNGISLVSAKCHVAGPLSRRGTGGLYARAGGAGLILTAGSGQIRLVEVLLGEVLLGD